MQTRALAITVACALATLVAWLCLGAPSGAPRAVEPVATGRATPAPADARITQVPSTTEVTAPAERRAVETAAASPVDGDAAPGVLSGRLLQRDGTPPQAGVVPGSLRTRWSLLEIAIRPDAAGRFELKVAPSSESGVLQATVAALPVPRGVRVETPPLESGAHHDLGDLFLDELPCLVRGEVVDDVGSPIAGVELTVYAHETVGAGGPSAANLSDLNGHAFPGRFLEDSLRGGYSLEVSFEMVQVDPGSPGAPGPVLRFRPAAVPIATGRSGPDGRFAIHAVTTADQLNLTATHADHLEGGLQDLAPEAVVTLRLQRRIVIEGKVLIAEGIPAAAIAVKLTHDEGGEVSAHPTSSKGEADAEVATYRITDARTGRHTLSVHLRGFDEPILTIGGIELLAGNFAPDPRLLTIDLRGIVHRYVFHAVDLAGRPLTDLPSPLLIDEPNADGTATKRGFPWRNGTVELFTNRPGLFVNSFAPGFAVSERRVGPGEHRCVFRPVFPLEVVLPGLREMCGAGRKVRVSVIRKEGTPFPSGLSTIDPRSGENRSYSRWHLGMSGGAWLGETDTVQVPLVFNGTYEIVLRLHEEGAPGESSHTAGEVPVVLDGAWAPRVVLTPDPERIRAAIAELEGRRR